MASRHPTVLWAQRKDRVFVSIQVEDVVDEKINVDNKKLEFSCKGGAELALYQVSLEFHSEIVPEESKQRKAGREYFFDLKKKEEGPFWPRLLCDKIKPKFLKIDFNRWKDEDESDAEDMPNDSNLEDMMKQMGGAGAGAFDPGSGPPMEEDSDDDDLPDLE